jgi:hypothetical protein
MKNEKLKMIYGKWFCIEAHLEKPIQLTQPSLKHSVRQPIPAMIYSSAFCSRQLRSDGPDDLRVTRHRLLQGVVLGLTGYNCSKLTPATQAVTLKPG